MAKTTKDITTFEGGIVNAVETSDAGEDKGTFRMVNMDGITKKGILKTSGSMVAVDPAIGSVDIQYMEPGAGFEIMPLDFDLGGDVVFAGDGSTDYSAITSASGTGTAGYATGKLSWTPNADAGQSMTFTFSTPTLTAGKWYSYEGTIDPPDNDNVSEELWITLDGTTIDTSVNNGFDNNWSQWGLRSSGTDESLVQKGIFKSDGSSFALRYASGNTALSEGHIFLSNLKITELSSGGSHELQFVQRLNTLESLVDIYQNGGDQTPTIGTPFRTLDLGDINSASDKPNLQYLKSSNAIRISDANFENEYGTKFFGFIDRQFFKDVELRPQTDVNSALTGDDTERHVGIKQKYWIEEPAVLTAPNANNCSIPCLGDTIASVADSVTPAAGTKYWHDDLAANVEYSYDKYHLRLEYAVVKDDNNNQPGNWNPSEDGQDGTEVVPEEKNLRYKFYCSFAYDRGAQESELTHIKQVMEQGFSYDGGTYTAGNVVASAWAAEFDGQIQLRYHDSSAAYVESGKLEAHDNEYETHLAWDCALKFRPTIMVGQCGASQWNLPDRCTGVNWYYSSSKDGHNKKYRLVETDFVDGIKYHSSSSTDFVPWTDFVPPETTQGFLATDGAAGLRWFYSSHSDREDGMQTIEDPPEAEDWDGIYGMKSSNWPAIKYKTAAIVGGQAYYGHVKVGTETHRDRILVSIGNHGYDMIPDDNYLDVVPGDGDEIVHLLGYNNQLYVFKRNKLVVADVGGEEDKVVAEHLVGGISNKNQACVTSKGVFWVNSYGAFLSTGSEANSLVLGKIAVEERAYNSAFAQCEWSLVTGSDPSTDEKPIVGYLPTEEQVFILSSTVDGIAKHFWKYDLKDESFWYHDTSFATASQYSNFALNKDLRLCTLGGAKAAANDGSILRWDKSAVDSEAIFDTGLMDFGSPSTYKQLYKVTIVAKNADANIGVKCYGISPNQSSGLDNPALFGLVNPTALNTTAAFRATEHKVAGSVGDVLDPTDDDEVRQVSSKSLFFKLVLENESATVIPKEFELHSVTFVYRDRGTTGA